MNKALVAKNLSKAYKCRTIVKDASLNVQTGEIVGLLGPNGAGKTTCFYMIVGLISSDKGHLYLNDTDITKYPMHKRASLGLGYLPQEPSVFRKLSVLENILAILELRKDLSKQTQREIAEHLLEEFHISAIRNSLGMSLSGGERRRVEIARALASNPDFILLDEPFAGVDPISMTEIKEIIKNLAAKGIGILITDHHVRETLTLCDKAYIMNEGQIIAHGNCETILNNEEVRRVYLGMEFSV